MTLKEWLINKIATYGAEPLSSLRYQKFYFMLKMPAPADFNAFSKYYRQTLKGKTFEIYLYFTINNIDSLAVEEVTLGDIKQLNNTMRITVWVSKKTLHLGLYGGWTGRPPSISKSNPVLYSGAAVYHA